MRTITIFDMSSIDDILDYVHDQEFDVEKLIYDKDEHSLKIPIPVLDDEGIIARKILLYKRTRHKILAAALVIKNVTSYEINDQSETGIGDINTIRLERDMLVIECGLPVTINLRIEALYIELQISDTILSHKDFHTVGFHRQP